MILFIEHFKISGSTNGDNGLILTTTAKYCLVLGRRGFSTNTKVVLACQKVTEIRISYYLMYRHRHRKCRGVIKIISPRKKLIKVAPINQFSWLKRFSHGKGNEDDYFCYI